MKKITVALLSLFVGTSVLAQGVAVQGVGTFSCGKYLEYRAQKNKFQDAAFVSWIWGYLAGFNMESNHPTSQSLPDEPSTLAYVDKYCGENPLNNVLMAANALIRDLGGKRSSQ